MAKLLSTNGVSYHLENLIKETSKRVILISPYLQFNDRIKEELSSLNRLDKDIRIVFRENRLQLKDNNWLEEQYGIITYECANLHAKCYINEKEAIITSMNLYQYSQQNNVEMGIYISKEEDPQLYTSTLKEVERILGIGKKIRISVKEIDGKAQPKKKRKKIDKGNKKLNGFCIRTGEPIPFNVEKPMTYEAYKSWNKYANPQYLEKYCHFSGEPSGGKTTLERPILKKNWKMAKKKFNL